MPTFHPSPNPSTSSKPTPRAPPPPNTFNRHTNSAPPPRTSSLALSPLPISPSANEPLALTQRAIIKDLKLKLLKYHADKKVTSDRIKKLERDNQQLHQELRWREGEIERLERRLAVEDGLVERSRMVEMLSKRLAEEVVLAEEEGRRVEEVEMCRKRKLRMWKREKGSEG